MIRVLLLRIFSRISCEIIRSSSVFKILEILVINILKIYTGII